MDMEIESVTSLNEDEFDLPVIGSIVSENSTLNPLTLEPMLDFSEIKQEELSSDEIAMDIIQEVIADAVSKSTVRQRRQSIGQKMDDRPVVSLGKRTGAKPLVILKSLSMFSTLSRDKFQDFYIRVPENTMTKECTICERVFTSNKALCSHVVINHSPALKDFKRSVKNLGEIDFSGFGKRFSYALVIPKTPVSTTGKATPKSSRKLTNKSASRTKPKATPKSGKGIQKTPASTSRKLVLKTPASSSRKATANTARSVLKKTKVTPTRTPKVASRRARSNSAAKTSNSASKIRKLTPKVTPKARSLAVTRANLAKKKLLNSKSPKPKILSSSAKKELSKSRLRKQEESKSHSAKKESSKLDLSKREVADAKRRSLVRRGATKFTETLVKPITTQTRSANAKSNAPKTKAESSNSKTQQNKPKPKATAIKAGLDRLKKILPNVNVETTAKKTKTVMESPDVDETPVQATKKDMKPQIIIRTAPQAKFSKVVCKKCNKVFDSNYSFEDHINSGVKCWIDNPQPDQCQKCGCVFAGKTDLEKHMKRKTPCDDGFAVSIETSRTRKKGKYKKEEFDEDTFNDAFDTNIDDASDLDMTPVTNPSPVKKFHCSKCDSSFDAFTLYYQHMTGRGSKCGMPKKSGPQVRRVSVKVSKQSAKKPEVSSTGVNSELSCEHCSKCFTAVQALVLHKIREHNVRGRKPAGGDVSSSHEENLKKKTVSPLEERKTKRKSTTLDSLYMPSEKRRKEVQAGDEESDDGDVGINCPYCDVICRYSWNLKRHLKDCEERLAQEHVKHRPANENISKSKVYVCKLCKEVFDTYKAHRQHRQDKHSNTSQQVTDTSDELANPESPVDPRVAKSLLLMCTLCNEVCPDRVTLRAHMKVRHGDNSQRTARSPRKPTVVHLRHKLPAGLYYPRRVQLRYSAHTRDTAVERAMKKIEERYGRAFVKMKQLDFPVKKHGFTKKHEQSSKTHTQKKQEDIRKASPLKDLSVMRSSPKKLIKSNSVARKSTTPTIPSGKRSILDEYSFEIPVASTSSTLLSAAGDASEGSHPVKHGKAVPKLVARSKQITDYETPKHDASQSKMTAAEAFEALYSGEPEDDDVDYNPDLEDDKEEDDDYMDDDDDDDMYSGGDDVGRGIVSVGKKPKSKVVVLTPKDRRKQPSAAADKRQATPCTALHTKADLSQNLVDSYDCDSCDYTTPSIVKLSAHQKLHKLPYTHTCVSCHAIFLQDKLLRTHQQLCHDEYVNEVQWRSQEGLAKRMSSLAVESPVKLSPSRSPTRQFGVNCCLQCDVEFGDLLTLTQHITAEHSEINNMLAMDNDDLTCQVCQFTNDSLNVMQCHIQMHVIGVKHQCSGCKALFIDEDSFELHNTICEKPKSVRKMIPAKVSIVRNPDARGKGGLYPIKRASGPMKKSGFGQNMPVLPFRNNASSTYAQVHQCEICEKTLSTRATLRKHMKNIHNVTLPGARGKRVRFQDDFNLADDPLFHRLDEYFTDDEEYDGIQQDTPSQYQSGGMQGSFGSGTARNSIGSRYVGGKLTKVNLRRDDDDSGPPEENAIFRCHYCKLTFTDAPALKNHLLSTHKSTHPCSECEKVCSSIAELYQHIKVKHSKHACSFCPYTARNHESLATHEQYHVSSNPQKCTLCADDKSYSNHAMLQLHYQKKHKIDVVESTLGDDMETVFFACNMCSFQSLELEDFDGHHAEHARKIKFKCKLCDKLFLNRFSVLQHQKKTHGKEIEDLEKAKTEAVPHISAESFIAGIVQENPQVQETLDSLTSIQNITDTGLVQPVDPQNASSVMTDGVTSNAGGEPMEGTTATNITSAKEPSTSDSSKSEEAITNYFVEISEYICDVCKKSFSKYFALKRHLATAHSREPKKQDPIAAVESKTDDPSFQGATNEQPTITLAETEGNDVNGADDEEDDDTFFCCDQCSKVFTTPEALQLHQQSVHLSEASQERHTFVCNMCDKQFKHGFSLHQHKKKFHQNVTPDFVFDESKGQLFRAEDLPPPRKKPVRKKREIYATEEVPGDNEYSVQKPIITDGQRRRKCRMCSASFKDSLDMMRHIRIAHSKLDTDDPEEMTSDSSPDIEYRCLRCTFTTDNARVFSAHEQSHREAPSVLHSCDKCSMKFTKIENLQVHQSNVHSVVENEEMPSQPEEELQPENDYSCWKCVFQTPNKQEYQAHMRSHDYPAPCPLCAFCAENEKQLEWHQVKHRKNAKLSCSLCYHLFYEKSALDMHVEKTHGVREPQQAPVVEMDVDVPQAELNTGYSNDGADVAAAAAAMQAVMDSGAEVNTADAQLDTDELQQLHALKTALEADIQSTVSTAESNMTDATNVTVSQQQQDVIQTVTTAGQVVNENGQLIDIASIGTISNEQFQSFQGNLMYQEDGTAVIVQNDGTAQYVLPQMPAEGTILQDADGNLIQVAGAAPQEGNIAAVQDGTEIDMEGIATQDVAVEQAILQQTDLDTQNVDT